jgi:hypothetical protein
MPRSATPDSLTHGEDLMAGLLARQVALLGQIRTLLVIVFVVLPVVGVLIALMATSSSPVGSFFGG